VPRRLVQSVACAVCMQWSQSTTLFSSALHTRVCCAQQTCVDCIVICDSHLQLSSQGTPQTRQRPFCWQSSAGVCMDRVQMLVL
jgi:hypothetical protein